MTPQQDLDRELMRRVAQGDAQAFDDLFARHYPSVVRFLSSRIARRSDLEDLAQIVLLRTWQKAGAFRNGSSVSTFIKGIARNVHLEALARASRSDRLGLGEQDAARCPYCQHACNKDEASAEVCRRERDLQLARAISSLPPQAREAIRLRVIESHSAAEAADLAGCTPDTLRRRLVRAFATLRRKLNVPSID
jgi:RNA polymerase sigma-70 factor (ECF subfamily)